MTPGEAVEIVAAQVLHELMVSSAVSWLVTCIEATSADKEAIASHLAELAPAPEQDRVDTAYALLAERAEEIS